MQPTASATVASRSSGRIGGPSPQRSRPRRRRESSVQGGLLGHYADAYGRRREIMLDSGAAGSVLVVDRDATTHGDGRLVAHLAADEPLENAAIVCAHYLRDAECARGRCRRLTRDDVRVPPLLAGGHGLPADELASLELGSEAIDRLGNRYRLEPRPSRMSIAELRWCRHSSQPGGGRTEPVSVREAVACLESYEPVCALTRRALEDRKPDEEVSTATLRAELRRVQESPIVLNRRLREVVLATAQRNELSMSEIAYRCGRVKRDGRGNESGETSWLARRIGLLSEAGRGQPTPWIHSDVLALIARRGLAVAPREVEST
jgi:hypothetical protein